MLAHVGAAVCLVGLVVAVDALFHALEQQAVLVARQQRIPVATPDHLDHVPAGAAEHRLEFLDDLAVAAHRAIEALQVAVDDEHQVVEALARGQRDRAQGFGLVHLAVAHEGPDLAVAGVRQAAVMQVAHEARLVDRHQRAQAHRHRRELPEVGHQPGVRVGRQAAAVDLLAEVVQLLLADPALEEGAGIDARRRVSLEEHQVALLVVIGGAEEMVEADVEQGRAGGEAGDVAAQFARTSGWPAPPSPWRSSARKSGSAAPSTGRRETASCLVSGMVFR